MYDLYFTLRLLEELKRADEARDSVERMVHLQACRYYRKLLSVSERSRGAMPDCRCGTLEVEDRRRPRQKRGTKRAF